MIPKIINFINQYHMIEKGDRIVVGVSGGADSVCLLYVLKEISSLYGTKVIAVHVNHGLRGEEADRDEDFVSNLCEHLGIECHKFHYNIKSIAKQEGLSEEETGRKIRYQTFLEVCNQHKCNKIAIAHNKNDNAETVLFHLFRGTGIRGMTGIEPNRIFSKKHGTIRIIRPLLCIERMEIENYLKEKSFLYRTDSTNLSDEYSRNKIRNHILSYVTKEINPQAVHNIAEAATKLREAEEFIDSIIEAKYRELVSSVDQEIRLPVAGFETLANVIKKGIVRKIMESLSGSYKDLESTHVDAVLTLLDKQVGRQIHLPYHMIAERDYHDLVFYQSTGKNKEASCLSDINPVTIEIPGSCYIPELNKYLDAQVIIREKTEPIPKSSCMKWFDYDKIENAVVIRPRKEGDYIQIHSTGGRKKLKDYLIDRKVPQKIRDHLLFMADGSHIMWVLDDEGRISEKYKVDETTSRILLMKLLDAEENEDDR